VVTAIERDHLDALGGSLESIAHSKAGIFKPCGLVIIAKQSLGAADRIVSTHAAAIDCSVVRGESIGVSSLNLTVQGARICIYVKWQFCQPPKPAPSDP